MLVKLFTGVTVICRVFCARAPDSGSPFCSKWPSQRKMLDSHRIVPNRGHDELKQVVLDQQMRRSMPHSDSINEFVRRRWEQQPQPAIKRFRSLYPLISQSVSHLQNGVQPIFREKTCLPKPAKLFIPAYYKIFNL